MGVIQVGGDLYLVEEALDANRLSYIGAQDLDCHLAVVFQVLGEVDRRHATTTQLPLDRVAAGQGGSDTAQVVVHRSIRCVATGPGASGHSAR